MLSYSQTTMIFSAYNNKACHIINNIVSLFIKTYHRIPKKKVFKETKRELGYSSSTFYIYNSDAIPKLSTDTFKGLLTAHNWQK